MDQPNPNSANHIEKDKISVNDQSTVSLLHYNNVLSYSVPTSFIPSEKPNKMQNIESEKIEDYLVVLNESPFKCEQTCNTNIQIQSRSTPQKTFSPTIFENAVKVVKSLFSPVKAQGIFYRTAPPITFNDVDSEKKIEEENIFSEIISNEIDQSTNLRMKAIESYIDGNGCSYELDMNQSVIRNGLNSIDSHNNTNDSYTTTVSRIDDSFQSTVTHFDDCIQIGGGEANEKIVLVENVIFDSSLNETLNAKNNSLNETLIKNISTGSLESEHLNDTFETSVRCNTSCKTIQDHKFGFIQKKGFHASFAKAVNGFGENELKTTYVGNVSNNFSIESKKESNVLEEKKISATSYGKTEKKLISIDEDENQGKVFSTNTSLSTLNSSQNFYSFEESILDIFTEKSNLPHKKAKDIENVYVFSGALKDIETVYEINLFCSADNFSEIDCLTYSENNECDALLEKFQGNKYPMDFEKIFNKSIITIPSNKKSDRDKTNNIAKVRYSGKSIFQINKPRKDKLYAHNCNNQKVSGESLSDILLHNHEDEKIYHTQNDLSHMILRANIDDNSFTRNSINLFPCGKLNIGNETENKNIVKWINDNPVHSNASDKSNSQSNPLVKEQCSVVSNLNFKNTDCTLNQWKFQNDPQFGSMSLKNKSEISENRIPLTSQKSYTVLYNLNPDFYQPVLLHYASDTEIYKLNNIVLGNEKFMDLNVTYCRSNSNPQDKMLSILKNNINAIDVYSDNLFSEIKETLPQQTILDNRLAIELTDSYRKVGTDTNEKTENKNIINNDSNLKHFTKYAKSFSDTKTDLELEAPILSPSQSLRTEKTIKILKLSDNENIDSQNKHVKIMKKTLNNEFKKMNSRNKFDHIPRMLSMDQNCLEVPVKNFPEANILFSTKAPDDKRTWEENISVEGTKTFLKSISDANSLKSFNLEETRFHLNQFELEKAQPIITKTWKKCDAEDLLSERDVNFHIIKKSLANSQRSESNFEYYLQGNERAFSMQNSFLVQKDSTLGVKKIIGNLLFDVEKSAINSSFKEQHKNESLNSNKVAISEVDIKKFNNTLKSVNEINSSQRLENFDESQILDKNINLSQLIGKQFTRIDVEKICKVVDDISSLYLCENISNPPLNFQNVDSFSNIKIPFENDQVADETYNFMFDNENALSSSCLDFLGSIEGKPSKRDYSRESLFIKFDPLVQTKNSHNLLHASERERENLVVMPLSRDSTNESLFSSSPLEQAHNFSTISVNPLSQKTILKNSNIKLNKLREIQNEVSRLKELYLHREEMNNEKINTYEKEVMKLRATALLLETKIKESENRGRLLVKKLNDQNVSMISLRKIVEEYCAYAIKLAKQFESIRLNNQREITALRKDRDCYATHLQYTEQAFSDVHSKYEKCKKAVEVYRKNGDILKSNIDELKEDVELRSQKILNIEESTAKEFKKIHDKINETKFHYGQEISRFKAQIRKNDLKVQTLQETLTQKIKENKELAGICDELIEGKK